VKIRVYPSFSGLWIENASAFWPTITWKNRNPPLFHYNSLRGAGYYLKSWFVTWLIKKILISLWNLIVHHCLHKSLPLYPILSQLNPVCPIDPYLPTNLFICCVYLLKRVSFTFAFKVKYMLNIGD
jgi:hypothetical protein